MNMTQAQLYDVISDRDNSKMFRGFITESILKRTLPANGIVKRRIFILPKKKW